MEIPDKIYLQIHEFPETTWCVDQINDDDAVYLLATPERQIAPNLLEVCKLLVAAANLVGYRHKEFEPVVEMARIALASQVSAELSLVMRKNDE